MTNHQLKDCKVAVIATNGFEESEMLEPFKALQSAGAQVQILSDNPGPIKAWSHDKWGKEINVDLQISEANADDYDALLLPGGVMSPDKLRINPDVIDFIRDMGRHGKPIAAICHGPWTLIEADLVRGKKVTSWPSLKTDLKNAGALWEDREVVTDQGLVTSRKPADLPAFCQKMLEEFAEGPHDSSKSMGKRTSAQIHTNVR